MAKGKFISYLKVSTDKQGRSGLGLEAQRSAVEGYLNGGNWTLAAEYVETERQAQRPLQANEGSGSRKAIGATVVFAKLDRLFRNTKFLLTLIGSSFVGDGMEEVLTLQKFHDQEWRAGDVKSSAGVSIALQLPVMLENVEYG
jgi:hypothetical protein